MNERLMELAIQSNLGPACESQAIAIKKFAELIVMECMKVVSDGKYSVDECRYNSHRYTHNDACSEALLNIKKHFGVEE